MKSKQIEKERKKNPHTDTASALFPSLLWFNELKETNEEIKKKKKFLSKQYSYGSNICRILYVSMISNYTAS